MKKPEKLVLHENSPSHRKSFTMWKEAERRFTLGIGTEAMIQSEKQRWREVATNILLRKT